MFPNLQYIQNNANVPPTTYTCGASTCLTGEILPSTSRTMRFQVIVRDNRANGGGIATDDMNATVNAGSGPFVVTSPNGAESVAGLSTQTVTWNVAGTAAAPVSAANVKISLSTDGGVTFPTVLAASTANDGTESVTMANVTTTTARIKVEAVGNIFFDMSNANFSVAAVTPPPAGFTITTDGAGAGTGTITAGLGINCTSTAGVTSSDCVESPFGSGAMFDLTATAAAGSTFTSWAGCDATSANVCSVTMTADRTVTATFGTVPPIPATGVQDTNSMALALDASGRSATIVYNATAGGATIFSENGVLTVSAILSSASTHGWSAGWTIKPGDFNGDGRTDLLFYNTATGAVFKGISDGAFNFTFFATSWSPGWQIAVLNLNGDTLADVFLYNTVTGQYFRGTGTGDGTPDFTYAAGSWSRCSSMPTG